MHRGIEAVRSFIESVDVYRDDRSDPTFLPPDEVDTLQGRLLRDQIVRLRQSSPYYSASLLDVDLPDHVSRRWLEQLPFTRKDDYQAAPERFRLQLEGANPYDRTWGLVHTTGTTTGEPTPFYDTGHDMLAYWQMLLRTCKIAGMTPDDVSVSVMPVPAMSHNAFISSRDACSVLNAPYVAAFVGTPHAEFPIHRRTDYALRLIERNQATVIWGIASYVRHLVMRGQELGTDMSSIRLVWALGEACPVPMREDLRKRLASLGAESDAIRINNGLGFTEMRGTFVECLELNGCHNPSPDLFIWEVVDEDSGMQLPDGSTGSLALTHLNRRGTALVRYLTGDTVSMTRESCANCGRSGERILPQYESIYAARVSDWVKFKGVLLHPAPILAALAALTGLAQYQVILSKSDTRDPYAMDRLVVRVAEPTGDDARRERLQVDVRQAVQAACEIRPDVEWVAASAIYDPDVSIKARRFLDERSQPEGA